MDISEIRKLIRLIQDTDVTEIEVSDGSHTVRLSRQSTSAPVQVVQQSPQPVAVAPAAHAAAPAAAATPAHDEAHLLKSPMVGTFYRAASPEAEPFASEGKKVKKGETLCIIEAMKLMNEIEAEYDGVVEEVLVENATPVEYGQPLFVIRPL